jgi:hypothetical protein
MVDPDETAKWLQTQTDAQLAEVVSMPAVAVGNVPGFTTADLRTASQVLVQLLAEMELKSRDERRTIELKSREGRRTRRVSWFSLAVSVLALAVAGLSLAWTVTRSPRAKDDVPAISSQSAPPPQLLRGTKFQQQ